MSATGVDGVKPRIHQVLRGGVSSVIIRTELFLEVVSFFLLSLEVCEAGGPSPEWDWGGVSVGG